MEGENIVGFVAVSKQSVKSCSHATKLSEFDEPVHMIPFRLRHYPNFSWALSFAIDYAIIAISILWYCQSPQMWYLNYAPLKV